MVFNILFVFVFLVGNDAALPDVGSCTFMEYYCSARKCSTAFIKIFQKDPKANCGAELSKLKNCVVDVMMVCMGDSLQESQVRGIVDMAFTEKQQCLDGSMEIPTMPPTGGSICSASFSSDADTCLRSFHQKFSKDKSDPALCSENAKAKRCLKNLIDSACNFPNSTKEALELGYSDYNPFCASNRDPGATGNDQCDGVQDKSGDALKYFNAAAGIKSVFLVGNVTTFTDVNVGSCTFKEYFCRNRKCQTSFHKAFQKDPNADCSAEVSKFKNCMVDVMKFCMKDLLNESQIKVIVNASVKKDQLCDGGYYAESPTTPPGSTICSESYNNGVQNCMRSFQQKYIKDRSDPALCPGYAETKKCLKDLIDSACNYPAETKKMLDFTSYGVYNPFCADNRDPGATKNDQCYGVVDDDNAAAGTKPSVFQTLMLTIFLFLFLFKA